MCNCQINTGYNADGNVELLGDGIRKALKDYTCMECGGHIKTGDKYSHETYVFDGKIQHHRMCTVCRNIRDVLFCSWCYGSLMDDLHNEISEGISEDCIVALEPDAREKVCDMVEGYWEYRSEKSQLLKTINI